MSKHVRVLVRTRPTADFAKDILHFDPDLKGVHVHIPKGTEGGYINNQQENWDFRFDSILHNCSQEKVYDDCARGIVHSLLDGYNGTILAYGQTGAGKTFTMTGATENYRHRGIIPRAISQVFREIADRPHMATTVRISYLEIYNEQIVDLLASLTDYSSSEDETPLSVVEDKTGACHVKGATVQFVSNEEEALNLLFEGETNRSIAEHQLNKSSTRSHCIFSIIIESRSRVESTEKVISSKLNLVDLAGSERISKTHTEGLSLKEAMYINKSLTFLEQVIIALADKKREHIPYRQSKLTHVLRDSLGGNCNTLMIANIWGEREHIEESISTLRFATRMMCVTTTPEINVQFDPMALIKKYEREIKELKQELAMHDSLSNRSHVQYEPFGEAQRLELQKQLKNYIEDDDYELEIVSLRQIREFFRQFKVLYKMLEAERDEVAVAASKKQNNLNGSSDKNTYDGGDAEMNRTADNERDDRVGEVELFGFGVGLSPSVPGGKGNKFAAKKRKSVKPDATVTASAGHHHDTEDEDGESAAKEAAFQGQVQRILSGVEDGITQLPPLPSFAKEQKASLSPSSRSIEFETYKRGKGAEILRILLENKVLLKDKRKNAKDLVEKINEVKNEIDKLKNVMTSLRHETNDGNFVVKEQDYESLEKLKELKRQYRDQFEHLKQGRTEISYCAKLVDQCRQKLMSDFEQWYESIYGAQAVDLDVNGQGDDLMDIGEKFDRLQIERMSQEDPDSLPYYNARKKTERRTLKVRKNFK